MKKKNMKTIYTYFINKVGIGLTSCCLLMAVTFASCKSEKKFDPNKPTITVTIEPFRYFVEQIADHDVNVNVMVPAGSNPETYEPTPKQMMELSQSALYFKVGSIGFEETWMKKLTDNAPNMKIIDTSIGITPAKTPGGNIDPHTWMSCTNARIISRNILKALCTLSPQNKTVFEKNYQHLLQIINKRDSLITQSIRENAHFEHKFVIYHPILTYFSRDYKLTQLTIEEEGREPSAAQIKNLIERTKKERIRHCLIQKEFANRNTTTFIKESQTKPIQINPLQPNWDKAMSEVASALCSTEK